MKLLSVIGTRPELIRMSRIIPKLDNLCDHTFVHTGQSYDANMRDIFFEELGIRQPDIQLEVSGATAIQRIGDMMAQIETVIRAEKPDRLLVLGDTNSVYAAVYAAKRLGVRVYHMEAGNRCFDRNIPEEINRMAIDNIADINMPYTEGSRSNLLKDGIASNVIYVTGNPIFEVMQSVSVPALPEHLQPNKYFLATVHREENVEDRLRLQSIVMSLSLISSEYDMPVIFSRHPRTKARMEELGIGEEGIEFHEPFGFLEFMALEQNARCVLTDSGTIQEECCCLLNVPCVVLRDTTERPETIECGASILAGIETDSIQRAVKVATSNTDLVQWFPPDEYMRMDVSDTVIKIVLGY